MAMSAEARARWRAASTVLPAVCGERTTFGAARMGLSHARRLDLEDVERRPGYLPFPQRFGKRLLVDQETARRIDEDRGRLHRPQLVPADEMAGFRRQRQVEGNDIRRGEQHFEVVDLFRAALPDRRLRQGRVIGKDAHPESAGADLRHARADIADADEAERPVEKLVIVELEARRISAAGDEAVHFRDAADGRQHHGDRCLGNGVGVAAGDIRDDDAARGCRGDVDIVDACTVLGDDLQPRSGVQQPGVDPDVPDDDRVGIGEGFRRRSASSGARRRIDDEMRREPRKTVDVDRVGDEGARQTRIRLAPSRPPLRVPPSDVLSTSIEGASACRISRSNIRAISRTA